MLLLRASQCRSRRHWHPPRIEDAIKLKENSGSIVEAISPKTSANCRHQYRRVDRAPAGTDLPASEACFAISLRGTDPGFTTTLLNGREQVSTGDNRSIEYDQYRRSC